MEILSVFPLFQASGGVVYTQRISKSVEGFINTRSELSRNKIEKTLNYSENLIGKQISIPRVL